MDPCVKQLANPVRQLSGTTNPTIVHNPQNLEQAIQLHQQGSFDIARGLYQQVLANDPSNAAAHHFFGLLEHQTGNFPSAMEHLQTSIRIQPNEVSHSGFYEWLKRPESNRSKMQKNLLVRIYEVYEQSRRRYGRRRVYQGLIRSGIKVGQRMVENLMR
ncbi:MAG: hypothetical protein NT142_07010, partial [Planctomycetota bacterium]|nr:hypothetical protein [Planctomycetota bacterium]